MQRKAAYLLLALAGLCLSKVYATEGLSPLHFPTTMFSVEGAEELDDDVYSTDMTASAEYAITHWFSLYGSTSFRFASYSYEYSTEGYVHNYCNLHVNGFNESYLGVRTLFYRNLGLDAGWRFPPGEGSQKERFHRLNAEPFVLFPATPHLLLGTALRYNTFLEDKNFRPGDEIGFKASLLWKFWWSDTEKTGWKFSEVMLYQARFQESENHNLAKNCRKMDDKYKGMKIAFALARDFRLFNAPLELGINYTINKGTLFGFETGHRVGIYLGSELP